MMNNTSVISRNNRQVTDIKQIRHLLNQWSNDAQRLEELSDEQLKQEVIKTSQIKRLIEMGQADIGFREQIVTNFSATVKEANLEVNDHEVEFLWRPQTAEPPPGFQSFMSTQSQWEKFITNLAGTSSNSHYKLWRERQIARCKSQVFQGNQTQHFPVSFELSKGCSVGCWFCGVAAPSLGDIFFYNPENAQLWQNILTLMKKILGTAVGAGFCYCATDPLDNPDYEMFLSDFYSIFGVFPQTTTAQPLKDPERTRKLLRLSLEKGCMINRFSIISLKLLRQLYTEFTPEELNFVGLVLQNPESGLPKSISGKARDRAHRQAEKNHEVIDDTQAGTTACVTGFLINMIDRSIKLISPHNASDRWPLGYKVYEESNFTNTEDLQVFLEMAISKHMQIEVKNSDRLKFRPDLNYETLADGFQLSTRYFTHKFRHGEYLQQLGDILGQGDKTVAEILRLFEVWGTPATKILESLNLMFQEGIFDEDSLSATITQ